MCIYIDLILHKNKSISHESVQLTYVRGKYGIGKDDVNEYRSRLVADIVK